MFPRSGPRDGTTKFARPVRKAPSLEIGAFLPKWYVGVSAGIQEFDWGYAAEGPQSLGSFSSGLLGSTPDRLILYQGSVVAGRRLLETKRWRLTGRVSPTISFFNASPLVADTATWNGVQRSKIAMYGIITLYQRTDIIQRSGAFLLLGATAELQYKIRKHHSLTALIGYQQGFRPIVEDYMHITRDFPRNREGQTYYTRVNGTSMPFAIGYSYRFGRSESNSTKYREIPAGGGLPKRRRSAY